MGLLLIDNYDSFTYNIVGTLRQLGVVDIAIVKNNCLDATVIGQYDRIILTPGPGVPQELPQVLSLLQNGVAAKKLLGICLGFQLMGVAFGGELVNLALPNHGVRQKIKVIGQDPLFQGIPGEFFAGLYHSWFLSAPSLQKEFSVTAISAAQVPMAFRHKRFDMCGVLFHPESYMTDHGARILYNWLNEKTC